MKHELLPASLRAILPPLYATEKVECQMVVAKYFTPNGNWTWYVVEGNPIDADDEAIALDDTETVEADFIFYGLVDGHEKEQGYFKLSELETCWIERDLYWRPRPLHELTRD